MTKVIINPRINEISKELAHNYSVKAKRDVKHRDDQYANDIQRGKEPQFQDVFRKIGNRAAGISKASRRVVTQTEDAPTNLKETFPELVFLKKKLRQIIFPTERIA